MHQAAHRLRHARKTAVCAIGHIPGVPLPRLPALLREHANFQLPVDEPGFLNGYAGDFDIRASPFAVWANVPIDVHKRANLDQWTRLPTNAPPPDKGDDPSRTAYIVSLLHGVYAKEEQASEKESREARSTEPSAVYLNWLGGAYLIHLGRWRYILRFLDAYQESPRAQAVIMMQIRWCARRAYRAYYGLVDGQ